MVITSRVSFQVVICINNYANNLITYTWVQYPSNNSASNLDVFAFPFSTLASVLCCFPFSTLASVLCCSGGITGTSLLKVLHICIYILPGVVRMPIYPNSTVQSDIPCFYLLGPLPPKAMVFWHEELIISKLCHILIIIGITEFGY